MTSSVSSGRPLLPHAWASRGPAASNMTTITPEKPFSVGKYLVSPLTRLTDSGQYAASVSICRGMHDRVLRFLPRFATREAARCYAIEQGMSWVRHPFVPEPL